MKTKRTNSKWKIIAASLLIISVFAFCLTLPHWWMAVPTAQIIYNGKTSAASRLYRARNGELLLRVSEPKEYAYLITPKEQKVYSPNFSNFSFFPYAAFVEHNDQGGIDLEYTAKTDVTPNIVAGKGFIEFTDLRKKRIRVSW